MRFKKYLKIIFNSSNWKNLKKNIKEYIKTKFKNLYINYIIIFIKIYKYNNNNQMKMKKDLNDDNDILARKRYKDNIIPHFLLLILIIDNK